MKKVAGRFALVGFVVILSIIFFIPSVPALYQHLPGWLKSVLPNKGITLGLDLQGGIHLVLEVEEERAVEIAVDRSVTAIQDLLVDKKIPVETVKRTAPNQVMLSFQNAELKAQIQKLMEDFPSFVEVESQSTPSSMVYEIKDAEIKRIKDSAINQALETIRNRIDQFGVAEPLDSAPGIEADRRAAPRYQGAETGQGPDQGDRSARVQAPR